MSISILPIAIEHADSFHRGLDQVARERVHLALLEAPPLEQVRSFVRENVEKGIPQVVALDGLNVVGWCDIQPDWHHTLRHRGSLGMGLLQPYRGRGLGEQLFRRCLERATAAGVTRVELEVREDNARALALYRRLGFVIECAKIHGMRVDGEYVNTIAMSLLVPNAA